MQTRQVTARSEEREAKRRKVCCGKQLAALSATCSLQDASAEDGKQLAKNSKVIKADALAAPNRFAIAV